MSREVFNTRTWNFLFGDRNVEGILRNLPSDSTLVIRNQITNVLPTISGILDLEHLTNKGNLGKLPFSIISPQNALYVNQPQAYTMISESDFFTFMLKEGYGITTEETTYIPNKELIIILGITEKAFSKGGIYEKNKDIIDNIINLLETHKEAEYIFIIPQGEKLLSNFRPYALKSYTNLYWDGYNAFSSEILEEAIWETEPKHITIVGVDYIRVFYTAIGAIDYFINNDAEYNNPGELNLADLFSFGKSVQVYPECTITNNSNGHKKNILQLSLEHLERDLKINIEADFRFASDEQTIAIDIL